MNQFILLTRDQFRESVFKRDQYKCIICGEPAQDAHHILERRLFSNGGYYLENGASLCGMHHLEAESTVLSCKTLREKVGIKTFSLPEHLYRDGEYDKWGNLILSNGQRIQGELFQDESVQTILNPVLHLFTDRVKYPRTFHLPWSPGATKDDRILKNTEHFIGKEVVVTVKMDGENTTFYRDYMHARSVEYENHPSRTVAKTLHAKIAYNIPEGWRICGENLFAKHTIKYNNLPAYFLVFSIWQPNNVCLSWNETKEWAELLDLKTVPELYRGIWNDKLIVGLYKEIYNGDPMEGYVVRLTDEFHYRAFRKSLAKFAKQNFVTSDSHWKFKKIEPNKLYQGNKNG